VATAADADIPVAWTPASTNTSASQTSTVRRGTRARYQRHSTHGALVGRITGVMRQRTRERLTEVTRGFLADGEQIEYLAHLLSRSPASITRNMWRIWWLPTTVEFAVLTNRRLLLVAADSQGLPLPKILREVSRNGLRVTARGGGYVRWVDLDSPDSGPFRLHIPRFVRREGELLFQALPD
jgi:hypothetical protein